MTADELTPVPSPAPAVAENAGVLLARAREDAGLSIEGIAAQLKLAPRQVRALEESDYAALPGRTFVRGFVRNYARLVHLDPVVVLAALPGDGADPAMNRPALATQGRAMGEIPAEHAPRRTWTRWAIPLALIAIVAVAVAYERLRPQPALPESPAAPAATSPSARPSTDGTPPASTTPLPNPVAATTPESPAPDPAARATDAPAGVMQTPAAPTPAVVAAAAPAVSAPANVAASSATAPVLELAFRGVSWIEVKDARGGTVLNMTGGPGAAQSVRATPPLDVVVGNATFVDVTFRGARVDLAPYTRQNIARLTLR
jgi:cytoskeleton protein RodZ